ncbi:MAG: acyl-CoA carboxylase subunit beta, partial [Acidimicrobiia bacterium]
LEGGKHRGAIGPPEGIVLERIVNRAVELGVPLVGVMATSGADIHEGVASLHAWGRVARAVVAQASGVVPVVFAVIGPCTSGPALLLGVADHVVMTPDAFAYVSGPAAVAEFTGVTIDHHRLGGGAVHDSRTGVASLVAADEDDALLAVADLLAYLPSHHLQDPPAETADDPLDRACPRAAEAVPEAGRTSYDVRTVVADVLDAGTFLEVRARYAPNMVTGYGRLGGRAVAVIANQPRERAGTLDIEASRKAARFVQCADAFNTPILTFVDTPGFEPGKDLEWRGMIRHGAELVHAYAAATVPRICLVLRKAYGGAYIVMDSKELGNDACFAWPSAEIAVMGAKGAVQVLFGKRLAAMESAAERDQTRAGLEADYETRFCT